MDLTKKTEIKNEYILIALMLLASILLPIPLLVIIFIGTLIAKAFEIEFTRNQWIGLILLSVASVAMPLFADYQYGTGYMDIYTYDANTKVPLQGIPVWVKCPSAGVTYYSDGWKGETGSTGRITFRGIPAGETCYYWVNPHGLTAYNDGGSHFISLIKDQGKKRTHHLTPKAPTCIPGQKKCSANKIHECYKSGSKYLWRATTDCGKKGCVCTSPTSCHCETGAECRTDSDCSGKPSPTPYGRWDCIGGECSWKAETPQCYAHEDCKDADPCTNDMCLNGRCRNIMSPDSDADGVCDVLDKCKFEPGFPPDGCPKKECIRDTDCRSSDPCQKGDCVNNKCIYTTQDGDGDGICDYYDKCPKEYGVSEHQGCPAPRITPPTPTTTITITTTTTTTIAPEMPWIPTTTTLYIPPYVPPYIPPSFCASDIECDDDDPCTLDKCVEGECTHIFRDKDDDGICDALDECPEEYGVKEYKGCPSPAPPWIWIGVGVAIVAILFMFAMRGRERIVFIPKQLGS